MLLNGLLGPYIQKRFFSGRGNVHEAFITTLNFGYFGKFFVNNSFSDRPSQEGKDIKISWDDFQGVGTLKSLLELISYFFSLLFYDIAFIIWAFIAEVSQFGLHSEVFF